MEWNLSCHEEHVWGFYLKISSMSSAGESLFTGPVTLTFTFRFVEKEKINMIKFKSPKYVFFHLFPSLSPPNFLIILLSGRDVGISNTIFYPSIILNNLSNIWCIGLLTTLSKVNFDQYIFTDTWLLWSSKLHYSWIITLKPPVTITYLFGYAFSYS